MSEVKQQPSSCKNLIKQEKRIVFINENSKDTTLLRKRKVFKPWQPKSSYYRKREVPLGIRLKGDIPRRLDRPYSEVDLADYNKYSHYDEFEERFDSQRNFVKDRGRMSNFTLNTVKNDTSKTTSVETFENISTNNPKRRSKNDEIRMNRVSEKCNATILPKINSNLDKTREKREFFEISNT